MEAKTATMTPYDLAETIAESLSCLGAEDPHGMPDPDFDWVAVQIGNAVRLEHASSGAQVRMAILDSNRIEFGPVWPYKYGRSWKPTSGDGLGETAKSITISGSKTPDVIAKQLMSRLLRAFIPQAECEQVKLAERDQYETETNKLAIEYAGMFCETPWSHSPQKFSAHDHTVGTFSLECEVGLSVQMDLRLDRPLAEKVFRLIESTMTERKRAESDRVKREVSAHTAETDVF